MIAAGCGVPGWIEVQRGHMPEIIAALKTLMMGAKHIFPAINDDLPAAIAANFPHSGP